MQAALNTSQFCARIQASKAAARARSSPKRAHSSAPLAGSVFQRIASLSTQGGEHAGATAKTVEDAERRRWSGVATTSCSTIRPAHPAGRARTRTVSGLTLACSGRASRPAAAPERRLRPARFLSVEIAPDSGEAVEQVLDTPRMEVLRERGAGRIVTRV